MPRPRPRARHWRRARCGCCYRGLSRVSAGISLGPRTHLDLEAVRLDGQRLLQHHLITMDVDQLEALQDHADRQCGFMHGKAAADAGALAIAERLPGIDGPRRLGLAAEIFWIERIGIGAPE